MAHEKDEPMQFIMFENREKTGNQPDYTGHIILGDGTKMRLAGWMKEWSKNGKSGKFVAGKMSEFETEEQRRQKQEDVQAAQPASATDSDDLPF
tara:strand:+ start:1877 stop:2158 length:282 start_codon:yes stop_codon:yes gene_type:complete